MAPFSSTGMPGEAGSSDGFSVMCIDDNVALVEALERRLSLEPGLRAFHRVGDFADSVDLAARVRPSIILLDIDLPGDVDAMELLTGLVHEAPSSRVIVFTGYPSGDLMEHVIAGGAWGFVSKGVSADRLIAAILQVVSGEAVIELED